MTPIERQILKNQIRIMETTFRNDEDKELMIEATRKLLYPKISKEFCCDMGEENKKESIWDKW